MSSLTSDVSCPGSLVVLELETTDRHLALEATAVTVEDGTPEAMEETVALEARNHFYFSDLHDVRCCSSVLPLHSLRFQADSLELWCSLMLLKLE